MNLVKLSFAALLILLIISATASAQLTRQWIARFNSGLKKSASAAVAMTVDPDSGNVLVTGWVTRTSSGIDIATLKYSNDGQFLWSSFYSGTGLGIDKPTAIAVDSGHSVYVTGYSQNAGAGYDYITLKYDVNGTLIWSRKYNGPGNGDDKATAIAVNDSLNVYVTGWSLGAGTGFDYATIKYKSNGDTAWVKRYNGPGNGTDSALGLALRGTTELYVTGTSRDTTYDYATIRYNPATGDSVWMSRYKGPGDDFAHAIAIRIANPTEVFITGGSQGIGSGYDIVTVRYDGSDGTEVWNDRYNGPANGDDQAYALAINGSSRLYVTGKSLGSGSFNDMVTLKYSLGGSLGWSSTYNGPGNDDDGAFRVTNGGNPYVIGSSAGAGVGQDFALVQYAGGSGNENFTVRYNGSGNLDDIPADVGTFGSGLNTGVFVTGRSFNVDKSSDFVTIKYIDLSRMKYRTFVQDSLIALGANLKVATANPNGGNVRDAAMLKAYPKIKYGYPGYPGGMTLGNMRRDSALFYTWIRFDKGTAVAKFFPQTAPTTKGFDSLGGKPMTKENKNPTTAKINSHLLGQLAALRINIGASDAEITPSTLGDLTYNDSDTGNHYNGMTIRQIASVIDNNLTYWKKYPPVNWAVFDTICTRVNRTFCVPMFYAGKNPLMVPGTVEVDTLSFLSPAIAPLENPLSFAPGSLADETPKKYTLYQNYPNPFNPATTIEFDLPVQSVVTLKIYDILGREIATLMENEQLEEGNHEVTFEAGGLASGVYFYRAVVNGGEHQFIKKMLLVR